MRTFARTLARTGVLQIDSVNVLQRAHYMPLFSRMGPYDVDLLHRAAERTPRRLVEYWAHVAAFMPVDLWPLHAAPDGALPPTRATPGWGCPSGKELVDVADGRDRRPRARRRRATSTTACRARRSTGAGTGRRPSRRSSTSSSAATSPSPAATSQFERLYDLPERVLPAAGARRADAVSRRRLSRAGQAGGASPRASPPRAASPTTTGCDSSRPPGRLGQGRPSTSWSRPGSCCRCEIEGWNQPAYLHRDAAAAPPSARRGALLSPFDPVVWERERTETLFDFFYRIEIYVPEPKRVHGYYVLPVPARRPDRRAGSTSRPTARPACCGSRRVGRAGGADGDGERAGRRARVRWPGWLGLAADHGRAPRRPRCRRSRLANRVR